VRGGRPCCAFDWRSHALSEHPLESLVQRLRHSIWTSPRGSTAGPTSKGAILPVGAAVKPRHDEKLNGRVAALDRKQRSVLAAACISGLALVLMPPIAMADTNRALRNYNAIMSGTKRFEELSEAEQQEVFMILRAVSRQPPDQASAECKDAWTEADAAADELESAANDLSRCAKDTDFSDDCSHRFRGVRSAHSDFESAVSEVQSECDG
jgi:hypothetical protein